MLVEGNKYRVIDVRKTINALIGKYGKKVHARTYKNLTVDLEKYVLVVRNLQRSHSPIIEAEACQELIKQGKTQKEISEITGIIPSVISQRLSLLERLPKSIQEQLRRQEIVPSVAQKIASLPKDVKNKIAKEEKITGELVEQYHREYLNSQVSFDDIDLPKEVKGTAVIRNYSVKYGDAEKDMTRKELFSFMEDNLPGLSGKEEIVIKRV
jgi:predicted transcriptional regulator